MPEMTAAEQSAAWTTILDFLREAWAWAQVHLPDLVALIALLRRLLTPTPVPA